MRSTSNGARVLGGLAICAAALLVVALSQVTSASAAQTVYEAESATISQGVVESNHAGHTGTGFVNYDNAVGGYVEWTVTATAAGPASLAFRFANGTAVNRPMSIAVNGTVVAAAQAFGPTGAWTTWQTSTLNAALTAGSNTIRATATTANGGPNVDSLTVDAAGGDPSPTPSTSPSPSPTASPGPGGTPVGINGKLKVCGTKLCNQYGHPIQLRGMSTHGLQWHANCINDASLDALAKDWNADIMRISMYIQEGGYETNPRKFTDLVHSIIEEVTSRGMYFIVDWHQLSPGNPHYNLARAKTFFTEIAQRHGNKSNIFYEVANEPSGVSWPTIKSYHEQIIPVIRAQDPDGIVLLGTRAWSSLGVSDGANEQEVINNQVNATNIMYTFHMYAASHKNEYLGALSRAADRIPMFVTEWGTQTYTGGGGNDFGSSQRYIDLMASKKISFTNWNYSHDPLSGAAFKQGVCPGGPYTGTSPLKPAGVWIRDKIRTPDNFPTN